MNPKNYIFRLFVIIFAMAAMTAGCSQKDDISSNVYHRGELRNAMRNGDISAKIALDSLAGKPYLYALGAVENLKGEIIIQDSRPFISTVRDSALVMDNSFSHKATLLVYSQVANWQEIAIPEMIQTSVQLQKFIAEESRSKGISGKPFAFLLKGKPATLDWHVIDWPEGDTEHTHEKHKRSGLNGSLHGEEVEILGFYSEGHHGVFTHHSTNMHLHFKNSVGDLAGHVDAITLVGGMKLYLPKE